jgi:hypothetical protein
VQGEENVMFSIRQTNFKTAFAFGTNSETSSLCIRRLDGRARPMDLSKQF